MDKQRTLLIVDDEIELCRLLGVILKRRFNQIEYAHTLTEARQKASSILPDYIVLDNNLPDGYGIEHIGSFKAMVRKPCRLIMISAMANLQQEALDAGADDFLEKPIVANRLLEVTQVA